MQEEIDSNMLQEILLLEQLLKLQTSLQQEAENLKSIDAANLTPEQLTQLVEKLSKMMDAGDLAMTEIKLQLDQIKTDIEDETNAG